MTPSLKQVNILYNRMKKKSWRAKLLMEAAKWGRGLWEFEKKDASVRFNPATEGVAQSGPVFLPYCLVIGRDLVHYSAWRDRSCRSHCLVGTHNNTELHTNELCRQTVKAPQPAQQQQRRQQQRRHVRVTGLLGNIQSSTRARVLTGIFFSKTLWWPYLGWGCRGRCRLQMKGCEWARGVRLWEGMRR